ncbi:MAG TPA: AAA family ATPase [Cyclobacteriaceae bacterium]|nr:AAA family ATPase [Cyclobacteriaceae bacterium]
MVSRIHFIGGIHGVGKSTICREICAATRLVYLSASELLKWKEINTDPLNKKVVDISMTQMRLVDALRANIHPDTNYLLGAHYCLFNGDGVITPILRDTFLQINPISLSVILGDVQTISQRLQQRDNKIYDQTSLQEMQNAELNHAKRISSAIGVNLSVGREGDISGIVSQITRLVGQL